MRVKEYFTLIVYYLCWKMHILKKNCGINYLYYYILAPGKKDLQY